MKPLTLSGTGTRMNLNESPDRTYNPKSIGNGQVVTWNASPNITFIMHASGNYATKLYPTAGYSHSDLSYTIRGMLMLYDSGDLEDSDRADLKSYLLRRQIYISTSDVDEIRTFLSSFASDDGDACSGRLFTGYHVVSFWSDVREVFPKYAETFSKVLDTVKYHDDQMVVECQVDRNREYDRVVSKLRATWDEYFVTRGTFLVPYAEVEGFVSSYRKAEGGTEASGPLSPNERHLAAAKGISSPFTPGFGSDKAQDVASKAGYDTVAAYHGARPEESQTHIDVVRILS